MLPQEGKKISGYTSKPGLLKTCFSASSLRERVAAYDDFRKNQSSEIAIQLSKADLLTTRKKTSRELSEYLKIVKIT